MRLLISLLCSSLTWAQSPSLQVFQNTKTLSGQKLDLNQVKGKTIIVNVWASWCAPCIQETPSLFKLVNSNKDRIALLSVSTDDSKKELNKFLRLYPSHESPNIYIIFDESRLITKSLGVNKLPETFVFAPDAKFLRQISGAVDWSSIEKTLLSLPTGK